MKYKQLFKDVERSFISVGKSASMGQLFSVQLFWFWYECVGLLLCGPVQFPWAIMTPQLPAQPSLIPSSTSQHKDRPLFRATTPDCLCCQAAVELQPFLLPVAVFLLPACNQFSASLPVATPCCLSDNLPSCRSPLLICFPYVTACPW